MLERHTFRLADLVESLGTTSDHRLKEASRMAVESGFEAIRGSSGSADARSTRFEGLEPLSAWQPPALGAILPSESRFSVHREWLIRAAEWHLDGGDHAKPIDHFFVAALVYSEVVATLAQFHRQDHGLFSWGIRSPSTFISMLAYFAWFAWLVLKWATVLGLALFSFKEAPLVTALIASAVLIVQSRRVLLQVQRERLFKLMFNVYACATEVRPDWHALRSTLDAATGHGALFDGVVHGIVARNLSRP